MARSTSYSAARIPPAAAPFDDDVQVRIDAVMHGAPPLTLFTTMARDRRLFIKYFDGGLLDRGHLTIRQREIVIDRTTALRGAEYEWGVHVTAFGPAAELTAAQITSLAHGTPRDSCWTDAERMLIELCDALHQRATVDDELWSRVRAACSQEAVLELLLLVGFYHTTSFVVNALTLPLEPGMARFDDFPPTAYPRHT